MRAALTQHQSILLRAPTGFGKSVVAAYMAQQATLRGHKVIMGVHRKELARQLSTTFRMFGIQHGFIAAGMPENPFALAQIASADTLKNRAHLIRGCKLFIPDESHLWAAQNRALLIGLAKQEGAKVVALSATPQRLDGKPLSGLFDHLVDGPSVSWLIEQGHLSSYRVFAPPGAGTEGLHTRMGDYITSELEERFDRPAILGDAVQTWKDRAQGLRTIVFAISRAHGRHVQESYIERGVSAVYIDGATPHAERRKAIEAFADGVAPVLVNIQLCTEGFDLSAQVGRDVPVEAAQLLRPTKSLALAMQMMGRALRKKPYPAIILDHVGIIKDHGLPDDEREWSLEGRTKKPGEATIPTRTCPECFAVHRPARVCPECGHEYAVTEGRQIEEVAGELAEIDVDALRRERKQEVGRAKTLPELVALAKARGYSKGWVAQLLKARGRPVKNYAEIEREWRK